MIVERIRPSQIKNFFDCSYRWYRDHIFKPIRKVSSAAHFGTAIHKSAEVYYKECIQKQDWIKPNKELSSIAVDTFRECLKNEQPQDFKEIDLNKTETLIVKGSNIYNENAQFLSFNEIPIATELEYSVKLKSSSVGYLAGTLDIVYKNSIGDIKTMNKAKNPKEYILQQSVYALLKNLKGEKCEDLFIHRVIKDAKGSVKVDSKSILLEYENPYNIDIFTNKAKDYLKLIVRTCEDFEKTGNELLFRGNPQSTLCSSKYCAYYPECKYRKEGV